MMLTQQRPYFQRGASFVEFNIIAIPLILLSLLGIEAIRFHQSRLMVTVALNEALRMCIVQACEPSSTLAAFEQALLPLFAPAGPYDNTQARQDAVKRGFQTRHGMAPWRLTILSPNRQHFADFANPILTQRNGRPTIRHSFMAEQHLENIKRAWPDGKGQNSSETIYDANTAHLRITYAHQVFTPGIGWVIKQVLRSSDPYLEQAYRLGLVVISVDLRAMMQSDGQRW